MKLLAFSNIDVIIVSAVCVYTMWYLALSFIHIPDSILLEGSFPKITYSNVRFMTK